MKLYEIDEQIEEILNREVDQETGEILPEAEQRLDQLTKDKERVALSIARYMKGEIAEGAAVKVEADRLARRAKAHESRAKWLLNYLGRYLKPEECYRDAVAQIVWRHSQTVEVEHLDLLPEAYVRVKTTREADKRKIAEDLKSGQSVSGASLVKHVRLGVK